MYWQHWEIYHNIHPHGGVFQLSSMITGRSYIRFGVSFAFILASVSCASLALQALCDEANIKAGIATFRVVRSPSLGVLADMVTQIDHSALQSHSRTLAPAALGGVSKVQSAARMLTTSLPVHEAVLPRNFTIGTQEFCVFARNLTCHRLPPKFNISDFTPLGIPASQFQSFNSAFTIVSKSVFPGLIASVILTFTMVTLSLCLHFGRFYWVAAILMRSRYLRAWILLLFGLICCAPFSAIAIMLHNFNSEAVNLPAWIQVEQGQVSKLCIGGVCCSLVMVTLSSIVPILLLGS